MEIEELEGQIAALMLAVQSLTNALPLETRGQHAIHLQALAKDYRRVVNPSPAVQKGLDWMIRELQ